MALHARIDRDAIVAATAAPAVDAPECPLCGGPGRLAYLAGEHRFQRCGDCRSGFVFPQPSPEALARFYAGFHRQGGQGWYDDVEGRMQADFPAKVAMLRSALGADGRRVLDVGCGKGYFARACLDAGLEASGIDLSSSGVAFARRELGVDAIEGRLEDHREALGVFDAATFWATIEHVPDPIGTLRTIRSVLRPGGRLLLDTGLGADWLERLLPGVTQWWDPPQHLFVFSRRGLESALESAGFRVVRVDPCFERSRTRRTLRLARGAVAAGLLRAAATIGRVGGAGMTRYPLGNLISMTAERVD